MGRRDLSRVRRQAYLRMLFTKQKKRKTMKLQKVLFLFSAVALMAACSSEEDFSKGDTTQPDGNWSGLATSVGVEEGVMDSRAIGELDDNGLPKAHYPNGLGIYLHKYVTDGSEIQPITLNEEGSDANRSSKFYYNVEEEQGVVLLNNKENAEGAISIKIGEYVGETVEVDDVQDLFFFASQDQLKDVEFPKVSEDENWWSSLYPDAREEFGDRLFCTDGYFFQWKNAEHTVLGLYLLIRYDNEGTEVKSIREITNWQQMTNLNLAMKRLTACISVRLMLIDRFETDGTIKNIPGMDLGIDFDGEGGGLSLTNKALQDHLQQGVAEGKYTAELAEQMKDFDVQNIFVRKKLFTNFPGAFDWEEGLVWRNRKPLYLCNLNYPAWVDDVIHYEHGVSYVHALTATCDNEPFIPADNKFIPKVNLVMYMGIGQRDPSIPVQGGTYDKVISYTIPFGSTETASNEYHVAPNTHTYIYIGLTLENIVELYQHFNAASLKNRSVQQNITLPSGQMMMFTEPYSSTK